eukprot:NODE_9_length_64580_cov_1.431941.p4 type:complete len:861 gc:universal NODE_9_length_64580_cov_1.431941:53026-50444(-)
MSSQNIDDTLNSLQDSNSQANDLFGVFIQFLFASITGIAAILAFTLLRPKNKKIYQPNYYVLKEEKHPPKLSFTFKWIYELIRLDDDIIVNTSGVDGLLTIKVLRMFLKLFLILTPVCLIVLIPIHLSGKRVGVNADLNNISLLTLVGSPDYLYAHTAIMYFITGLVFYFTVNMWHYYITVRQRYVTNFYNTSKLVFYTGISNKNKPFVIDRHVYKKHNIQCTGILLSDPSELVKLFAKYNANLSKLEKFCHENPDNPDVAIRMIDDLTNLKQTIFDQQQKGLTSIQYLPSGFGIFRDPEDAYEASSKSILRSSEWTPYHAVDVNDIVWNNVKMVPAEIKSRRLIGRLLTLGLVCFWMIPIIFLAPLTDLHVLSGYLPFIATLVSDYPKFAAFIQSVLTPLLLKLLLIFIPDIFYFIANLQAEPTNTEIQKATMRKLFSFFIIGYYLLFTLSGSIWSLTQFKTVTSAQAAYETFNKFTISIAYNVANKGIYWINWLTLNGPGSIPIDLARFLPFIMLKIKMRWSNPTAREYKELLKPPKFRHDVVLTSNLFMFFLAIAYATIHPIILVFGLFFFGISYVVYKYQVIYVFSSDSDTAGSFWPLVFNRIYAALLFSQAILILLFRVYDANIQSYLLMSLFIATFIGFLIQKRTLKRKFKIPKDEAREEEKFQILHPLYFSEPEAAMLDPKMQPLLLPYLKGTIGMAANDWSQSTTTFNGANTVSEDFPLMQKYKEQHYGSSQSLRQPNYQNPTNQGRAQPGPIPFQQQNYPVPPYQSRVLQPSSGPRQMGSSSSLQSSYLLQQQNHQTSQYQSRSPQASSGPGHMISSNSLHGSNSSQASYAGRSRLHSESNSVLSFHNRNG